jgi:biotin carboxylase
MAECRNCLSNESASSVCPSLKCRLMKNVFQQEGLIVAEGERVTDLEHGLRLGRDLGYPVILKPDEGVGASGIYKIET